MCGPNYRGDDGPKGTVGDYKDCTMITINDNPYCEFHKCGAEDYCQCKKSECPHCYSKSIYEYNEPDEKNPGDFYRKISVIKNLPENLDITIKGA